MRTIRRTAAFDKWLKALRDRQGAGRIVVALTKLAAGLGDMQPIGEGVSELRLHFGPGYRVYFVERGEELIIVLCGGDKGSQRRDIEEAKLIAQNL